MKDPSGRYFVSDAAENATTQQIIDNFKVANEAKAALGAKLKALGESLARFGKALQAPDLDKHSFSVDETEGITIRDPNLVTVMRPTAQVTPAQFDWKDLCETLTGYVKATADRKHGAATLEEMGIPVRN